MSRASELIKNYIENEDPDMGSKFDSESFERDYFNKKIPYKNLIDVIEDSIINQKRVLNSSRDRYGNELRPIALVEALVKVLEELGSILVRKKGSYNLEDLEDIVQRMKSHHNYKKVVLNMYSGNNSHARIGRENNDFIDVILPEVYQDAWR